MHVLCVILTGLLKSSNEGNNKTRLLLTTQPIILFKSNAGSPFSIHSLTVSKQSCLILLLMEGQKPSYKLAPILN